MSSKRLLSEADISSALSKYISKLSPDETALLISSIKQASKADELPQELQTALNFQEFKIPTNIHLVIRRNIKYVVSDLCESPTYLKPSQCNIIQLLLESYKHYILNYLTIVSGLLYRDKVDEGYESKRLPGYQKDVKNMQDLQRRLSDQLTSNKEFSQQDNPILVEYCNHLMQEIREVWKREGIQKHLVQNGRQILVIEKPVLLLSDCIENAEKFIEANSLVKKVEEVRFIAQEICYIDCPLNKSKWHGINILVIAKTVSVVPLLDKTVTWDVSGLHGTEKPKSPVVPKKMNTQHGSNGRHGNCGDNGGHVTFLAKEFDGMEYLNIVSNGGRGEDGENGENGKNGIDGRNGNELSPQQMKQMFGTLIESEEIRKLTLNNLNSEIVDVVFSVPYKITKPRNNSYRTGELNVDLLAGCTNFYMKALTKSGLDLECGFRKGAFVAREAFLLVKGQAGKPGTQGGLGGRGGHGGLGGEAGTVRTAILQDKSDQKEFANHNVGIKTELNHGENGKRGQTGHRGQHGKFGITGRDVGFVESKSFHLDFPNGETPGYFELATYETKQDGCVYSEYHGMYVTIQTETISEHQEIHGVEEVSFPDDDIYENIDGFEETNEHLPKVPEMEFEVDATIKQHLQYVLTDELKNKSENVDTFWWRNKFGHLFA